MRLFASRVRFGAMGTFCGWHDLLICINIKGILHILAMVRCFCSSLYSISDDIFVKQNE